MAQTGERPIEKAAIGPNGPEDLPLKPSLRIGDLIPLPEFREYHSRYVDAFPAAIWKALHRLRLGELRISRALMAAREFPRRIAGAGPSTIVTEPFLEQGPVPVVGREPNSYVVGAGVMQAWKLGGGQYPPKLDAAEFLTFSEPGWIKLALDFRLSPEGRGTRLSTETRVVATDNASRRSFALYWVLIRAGSGLIRRDMLRAVARAAERGGSTA